MKTAAVLCALVLAGLAAGAAFGDILPPAPTVPTVTTPVPLPPVPTPTVPVPVNPPPAPKPPPAPAPPPVPSPPPVSVPSVTTPVATTPSVGVTAPTASRPVPSVSVSGAPSLGGTSGGHGGAASAGGGGSAGSGGSGGSSGGASAGSAFVVTGAAAARSGARSGGRTVTVARLHASRAWISATGPASHHKTTLTFRLRRRARVVFIVTQIAPECRVAGRFAVKGHRGTNRVGFNGRVHGQTLAPGTYRIAAHVVGGGRTVLQTVVAIFGSTPTTTELSNAQHEDACAASRVFASSATLASGGAAGNTGSGASQNPEAASEIVRNQNGTAGASPVAASNGTAHVTAAPFSPTRISKNATNPLVILALAAAVVLLGIAALPQEAIPGPRLTDTVARHRLEVALAGGAALTTALLALALA